MGVTAITPTQAFTGGCDLWITGQPEDSLWTQKIDWVLNFQILRASRHEKKHPAAQVEEFAGRSGLKLPAPHSESQAPLLIAADLNLPCRWVLTPAVWDLEALVSVWRQLGQPSLRIFLPKNRDADAFTTEWNASTSGADLQLVVE